MNILLVSHAFPPDMGAASTRTWNIAKALSDAGHEVQVLAGRPYYPEGKTPREYWHRFSREETHGKVKVRRIWVPSLATKGMWRRAVIYLGFTVSYSLALLRYFFNDSDTDMVFYISPYSLSCFSLPALVFGKLHLITTVLDVHDAWPDVVPTNSRLFKRTLGLMTWISKKLTDKITIASESMKLGSEKESLLPLSVDTDLFRPIETERSPFFMVGYSGTLSRRYDFDTVLKAAKMLEDRMSIVFSIRGFGEMAEEVREKKGPNVILSTDSISAEEVVSWLNKTDVLLCPIVPSPEAEKSSVPYKLIEYMSVGKPVVATSIGNVKKMMVDAHAVALVPPRDPMSMAVVIRHLAENPALVRVLGENGRSYVERNLSLPTTAKQIEAIVQA